MKSELPAIAKHAARVAACLEEAVTRFPKRYKYGLGADLRGNAMQVMRAVRKAWRERSRQLQRVYELSAAIDDLKDSMMLAESVGAFGSFNEFEAVARLVNELGRQCGGWLKSLHTRSQNGFESSTQYGKLQHYPPLCLPRIPNATRLHIQEGTSAVSLRSAHGHIQCERRLALPVRLREREGCANAVSQSRDCEIVRLPQGGEARRTHYSRNDIQTHLSALGLHGGSLLPGERAELQVLRRTRHSGVRSLAYLSELLCGHGRPTRRMQLGSHRQCGQLRAVELPVGTAHCATCESARYTNAHVQRQNSGPCGLVARNWGSAHHDTRPFESWGYTGSSLAASDGLQTPGDTYQLELKADQRLRPLTAGIDFLGYVIYPRHTVVRRRVVGHCRAKLHAWERRHVHGRCISAGRTHLEDLRSVWASYAGHFRHANSYRLQRRIVQRFQWLPKALV